MNNATCTFHEHLSTGQWFMHWIVLSALGTTGPWAWSNIVFLRITHCCLALNQRCFTWYGNINSFNAIGLLAYEILQTNHSFTYFYSYSDDNVFGLQYNYQTW